MKTYKNLYKELFTIKHLQNAYVNAKRHKTNNPVVKKFQEHEQYFLCNLLRELRNKTYKPLPLRTFILRDPKTRKICVSHFRDRVVHHALVSILQPIFEPYFIYDSHASRKGKGTRTALKRFEIFLHKVTQNGKRVYESNNANAVCGFALKADIKHYFETVDHAVLIEIIEKKVKDPDIIWLVRLILDNYDSNTIGKGMPLGNWTSQFFANVYLNELDQFVKNTLKIKYYIRYVDDFIILNHSKTTLQDYLQKIKEFLAKLRVEIHPSKCQIIPLSKGISFLGFRIFYNYKIPLQRNIRKIYQKIWKMLEKYKQRQLDAFSILKTLEGWNSYAMQANTYKLRQKIEEKVKKQLELRTKN